MPSEQSVQDPVDRKIVFSLKHALEVNTAILRVVMYYVSSFLVILACPGEIASQTVTNKISLKKPG